MHIDEFVLNEYLDETLSGSERDVVAHHLATCPECQTRLAELQLLFGTLAEVAEVKLATDLTSRVLANLPKRERPRVWLRVLIGVQVVTAVILLTILWPIAQSFFMTMSQRGQAWLTAVTWPPDWWERVVMWGTVVLDPFPTSQLTISLAAEQWLWLIGLALIAWLVGNTVLLKPKRRQPL